MATQHTPTPGLTRRTMITGAAWATPAIALIATTPAHAASGDTRTMSVWSPEEQTTAGGDPGTVIASVTDANGTPAAGVPVTFTGPDNATLTPADGTSTTSNAQAGSDNGSSPTASNTTTVVTDTDGLARAIISIADPWAKPQTIAITATTSFAAESTTMTLLGANVYALGSNGNYDSHGVLVPYGTGSTEATLWGPTQLSRVFPVPIVALASAATFCLALLENGTVMSVGINDYGQLGDGSTNPRSFWGPVEGLSNVLKIAAAGGTAYALLKNGTIMAWGSNGKAALGNGSTSPLSKSPVQVRNLPSTVHEVYAYDGGAYALLENGDLYTWGSDKKRAVRVQLPAAATDLAFGYRGIYALLVSGDIYTWDSSLSTPTVFEGIPRDDPPKRLASCTRATYALLQSGTVKAWGNGFYGSLGNGGKASSATPVTVIGTGPDNPATEISASGVTGFALQNGTVTLWGGASEMGSGHPPADNLTSWLRTPGEVQGLDGDVQLSQANPFGGTTYFIRQV